VTHADAARLARDLMDDHGLHDWTFALDRARRRLGSCHVARRRITLSGPLVALNDVDVVRDTVLHEIAHALTPGDGHGARWRAACRRLGARPARCAEIGQVVLPPAPYALVCDDCGARYPRFRRGRGTFLCGRCSGGGSRRRVLRWEPTPP